MCSERASRGVAGRLAAGSQDDESDSSTPYNYLARMCTACSKRWPCRGVCHPDCEDAGALESSVDCHLVVDKGLVMDAPR